MRFLTDMASSSGPTNVDHSPFWQSDPCPCALILATRLFGVLHSACCAEGCRAATDRRPPALVFLYKRGPASHTRLDSADRLTGTWPLAPNTLPRLA